MKLSEQSWDAQRMLQEYGVELQPWQLEILDHWKGGNLLVKAARRSGKDTFCALLAMELVKAGYDVVIACCNQRSVESLHETFQKLSRPPFTNRPHGGIANFEVTNHNEGKVSKISVRSRIARSGQTPADVGIVNEAGCAEKNDIDALLGCCQRVMMISSWPPEPDRNRFGWLWRYGGLAWQRLEVPSDLEYGKEHISHFSDDSIYNDLLRSPAELGRKSSC
jgi:hypothetical protein